MARPRTTWRSASWSARSWREAPRFWRCQFGIRLTKDVLFGDFKWFMMIFARDICKYHTPNQETRNLPSHHHHVHHPSYPSLRNALWVSICKQDPVVFWGDWSGDVGRWGTKTSSQSSLIEKNFGHHIKLLKNQCWMEVLHENNKESPCMNHDNMYESW